MIGHDDAPDAAKDGDAASVPSVTRPPPPADAAWRRFRRLDLGLRPDADEVWARGLEAGALACNLDAGHATLAMELVALAPTLEADASRALTLLTLATLLDVAQGSTRTPLDPTHLRARFAALLRLPVEEQDEADPWVERALRVAGSEAVPSLIGRDSAAFRPLVRIGDALYHHRLLEAESRLADALAARLVGEDDATRRSAVDAALADLAQRPTFRGDASLVLSPEQRAAVAVAAVGRLTLVSGGPGTGKTSIVVALVRTLARLGVAPRDIALAAPTGKAAWRLGDALQAGLAGVRDPGPTDRALADAPPAARTLHRLLGYSPGRDRYAHDAARPLPAAAVIIDESSMIDVFVMARLLDAVRPDAVLVLLGDADQLPSVAAGAVFRDALAAAGPARVTLSVSYRMRADDPGGAAVLRVARAIEAADARDPFLGIPSRMNPAELTGAGVEHLAADPSGLRRFLDHWYAERVRVPAALRPLVDRSWVVTEGRVTDGAALDALFAHPSAARVLCLTRHGDAGAERTNARLHAAAARDAGRPDALPFLVGEPVLMLHNDYERRLFNGDQGIVLWSTDATDPTATARRMVVFPGRDGYRGFHLATLAPHLALAHAMTVHKAQGSELDHVALLLPIQDGPLATRELLYTALTRARHGVVLVGDLALARRAARRPSVRHGGLAERLGGAGRVP